MKRFCIMTLTVAAIIALSLQAYSDEAQGAYGGRKTVRLFAESLTIRVGDTVTLGAQFSDGASGKTLVFSAQPGGFISFSTSTVQTDELGLGSVTVRATAVGTVVFQVTSNGYRGSDTGVLHIIDPGSSFGDPKVEVAINEFRWNGERATVIGHVHFAVPNNKVKSWTHMWLGSTLPKRRPDRSGKLMSYFLWDPDQDSTQAEDGTWTIKFVVIATFNVSDEGKEVQVKVKITDTQNNEGIGEVTSIVGGETP